MRFVVFFLVSSFLGGFPSSFSQTGAPSNPKSNIQTAIASSWGHEDWSALPLANSGLNTSRYVGVVLGKYEEEGYTREWVRVQWRPADPIDLYLILPHGVKNPPAVIYLYDYRYGSERFRNNVWCEQAVRGGVAAVGFTTALSIERFHSRPMKQWFVSELQEALGSSVHDVEMILNYITSRGDIDMNRIGMFGQGSGGAVAVLAAATDSRILALDLLNPWGDWPDWLRESQQIPESERGNYLTPKFLNSVSGLDPAEFLPRLPQKAVRVQQLLDDQVTPLKAKDRIASAVHAPHEIERFPDIAAYAEDWKKSGMWLNDRINAHAAQ